MQDRANVSADFLDLMKQEIIEVIKKYIDVDESAIDVRMTNRQNEDGTSGAPALYANIPIVSIKDDVLREKEKSNKKAEIEEKEEQKKELKEEPKHEENKEGSVEKKEDSKEKDEKKEIEKQDNKKQKIEEKGEESKEEKEPKKENEAVETSSKQ